jgi:hypothetical protein
MFEDSFVMIHSQKLGTGHQITQKIGFVVTSMLNCHCEFVKGFIYL